MVYELVIDKVVDLKILLESILVKDIVVILWVVLCNF